MSKCKVDGCNRGKDLSQDGFCLVCVRASAMRAPGPSGSNMTQDTNLQTTVTMNQVAGMDLSSMENMAQKVNSGEPVDQTELLKGVFEMVYGVAKSLGTIDQVKTQLSSNTKRIEALETKLGDKDEISLALGLVVLNLTLPPHGISELEYARAVIKEVHATGVDVQVDVVKAVRLGYKAESNPGSNDGRLGKVEIEVSNIDVKARIMKTKRVLENHSNEILRKIKIFNKKTQEQQNQEFTNRQLLKMIPGGNAWYIAGNGQLRQQTRHPNPRQNFPNMFPQQSFSAPPPFYRHPSPGPSQPNPNQTLFGQPQGHHQARFQGNPHGQPQGQYQAQPQGQYQAQPQGPRPTQPQSNLLPPQGPSNQPQFSFTPPMPDTHHGTPSLDQSQSNQSMDQSVNPGTE